MSIFLLLNPRCVLIHIPKTGGTSIRKGVWAGNYLGPAFRAVPAAWKNEFKFAFVRHPLCRLASAYRMFTDGAKGDPSWSLPADARHLTFDEFLEIVLDESIIYDERRRTFEEKIRHHTIPQTHSFNALREADFIGRYENMVNDFRYVSKRVCIKYNGFPRLHFTSGKPFIEYFSADSLKRAASYYENDFLELDYPMPTIDGIRKG